MVASMADTAELRKARGAFFTPPEIASFLARWVIGSPRDTVLEPSCGEAVFLLAVVEALCSRGDAPVVDSPRIHGVDIHEESVRRARALLAKLGVPAQLRVGDFFDQKPPPEGFDGVLGNPPYVRYQEFAGSARAKARAAALAQGVPLTALASSWAPFTVHAASFLKPEGRLGLVLPAELLSVNYAAPVRRFLLQRFAEVKLILFQGRVFPGVSEEVILLLAQGTGPTDGFELFQAKNLSDLGSLARTIWKPADVEDKWLAALLPPGAAEVYREAIASDTFTTLDRWGDTGLGMVTGNNRYFTLSREKVQELGLTSDELLPISPPSSRHLRGLSFTKRTWRELEKSGSSVYLFDPDPKHPSGAARRYIKEGLKAGINNAYKCRVRTPWWVVPKVRVPDLFLTYMNYDTPRLVANRAKTPHLNSVHGVTLRRGFQALGQDLLPIGSLNSLTVLGSELVGRAYGGGMLKLEPKEADRLPVPSPASLEAVAHALRSLRPQLSQALRCKDLARVIRLVDREFLRTQLGLKTRQLEHLRRARELMFSRRSARAAKL